MIFLDTETCGLWGPVILIQWAKGDGRVHLHEVFREPVWKTLELIKQVMENRSGYCGFNLAFDHWHLQRANDVLRNMHPNVIPSPAEWAQAEALTTSMLCIKPRKVFDLMLYAQKGPFQSLMARDPVWVRKVPTTLAKSLAEILQEKVQLDDIYFSKRRDGYQWQVQESDKPGFSDVILRFGASSRLKRLAAHCLKIDTFEIPLPKHMFPDVPAWNFKDAGTWMHPTERQRVDMDKQHRTLLDWHIDYWGYNHEARRYAIQDVEVTRGLYKYFGEPAPNDDDSVLACQVACSRHRGFAFDKEMFERALEAERHEMNLVPRAPRAVLEQLRGFLSPVEAALINSTDASMLEKLAANYDGHKAGIFARQVSRARSAEKLTVILERLLSAGRAHPDFRVIGTLSGRMSGSGGINYQGIPAGPIRNAFTLADGDLPILDGGDFDAFEVSIFEAACGDENLRNDLLTGKKIHALFGAAIYKVSYDEIMATKNEVNSRYARAKGALFAYFYGAQIDKIASVLKLSKAEAQAGLDEFMSRYPGVRREQQLVFDKFCSMRQPEGIGTRVVWHEPDEYVESLLGYRRYFTLENMICRTLFEIAQKPPSALRDNFTKVERRKGRTQTAGGALQSALYACAFGIQARNMRSAGNHRIQSTGAEITKRLQRELWDVQPWGVHPWRVSLMQVHDEVVACRREDVELAPIVDYVIEEYKKDVPLIAMNWKQNLNSWGDLK